MVDTSRNTTTIGPSMLVSGNLQGDEDLTVLGRVEGNVHLSRTLIVENGGIVKADVDVRNAVISGVVVGNVSASDSVEITETGRVVGDISSPRVLIVDGARFRGLVDMGDLDAPRASEPLPARTVSRSGQPHALVTQAAGTSRSSVIPARRSPPPPPPPASASASAVNKSAAAPIPTRSTPETRPASSPDAVKSASAKPSETTTRRSAPSAAAKKKAKKKVVVRKKKKTR